MGVEYTSVNCPFDVEGDLKYLGKRGVENFVHFTRASNLESILRNGLLPRKDLDGKKLAYDPTDDNRFDGTDAINLSITNLNISMFYKKSKRDEESPTPPLFAVLVLDPQLLRGVARYEFKSKNAADGSMERKHCSVDELFCACVGKDEKMMERKAWFQDDWPTDQQAEVRVFERIDPRRIKEIHFPLGDWQQAQYAVKGREDELKKRPSEIANLAYELGLDCQIVKCDRYFAYRNYNKGKLEPIDDADYERQIVSCHKSESVADERIIKDEWLYFK